MSDPSGAIRKFPFVASSAVPAMYRGCLKPYLLIGASLPLPDRMVLVPRSGRRLVLPSAMPHPMHSSPSVALQDLARNPRWQFVAEWMWPQVVESEPVILDPGSLIHILVFYSTTHCSSLLRNIGQRACVRSPVTGHFSPGRQVLERRIRRSRRQNFNTYVHTTI